MRNSFGKMIFVITAAFISTVSFAPHDHKRDHKTDTVKKPAADTIQTPQRDTLAPKHGGHEHNAPQAEARPAAGHGMKAHDHAVMQMSHAFSRNLPMTR